VLKIWGRANSINVQKVLWCCGELGLEYERIDAGNEFAVNKTAEYRALNPNGLVPTIEDGGIKLWESNVIVRYLAHKTGDGRLCPADIGTRFQLIRTPAAKLDSAVISEGERRALAAVRILDQHLSDRAFLAGDAFSMGDIPAAATVHRWYALDIEHPVLPNVQRWYDLMKQRQPFREVVMTPLS
jgi:glutathione S-transferase